MGNLLNFGAGHRTQLVAILAVISGIVTMWTSGGDATQMNTGWTQVLGGLGVLFLRQGAKATEQKVQEVHAALQEHRDVIERNVCPPAATPEEIREREHKTEEQLKQTFRG